MTALDFLLTLWKIRGSDVLTDKEKNARIMVLVAEELDEVINGLIKGSDKK